MIDLCDGQNLISLNSHNHYAIERRISFTAAFQSARPRGFALCIAVRACGVHPGELPVILHPGFLDHWKTRLLVELTSNESAPLAVLRLWEFCQMRRRWKFNGEFSDAALDTICRLKDARDFLTKCGFLDVGTDESITVHDWQTNNSQLVSSWKNGAKGGRPKSYKTKPTGYPRVTRGQPNLSNLILSNLALSVQKEEGFGEEWQAFIENRKRKRAPLTQRAAELIQQKLNQRPKEAVRALQMAITRNWTGFEWSWYDEQKFKESRNPAPPKEKIDPEFEEAYKRAQERKAAREAK